MGEEVEGRASGLVVGVDRVGGKGSGEMGASDEEGRAMMDREGLDGGEVAGGRAGGRGSGL